MLTIKKEDLERLRFILKDYDKRVKNRLKDRKNITAKKLQGSLSILKSLIPQCKDLLNSKSNISMYAKEQYLKVLKVIPFTVLDFKYFALHYKESGYINQVCCNHCGHICKLDHGYYAPCCSHKCGLAEKEKRYEEEFYNKIKKKYGNSITLLTKFKNYHKKIKVKCNTCKSIFYSFPQNLLRQNACKNCANIALRNPIYWEWDAFFKRIKKTI